MNPKKYRNLPVEIEAMQLTRDSWGKIVDWIGDSNIKIRTKRVQIFIQTLEGKVCAQEGDYVIKGVVGEFYPCRKDIFESTYEEVK
jgi:hypothetical protein